MPETPSPTPIHLFAFFPGTNADTLWTDPRAGSQIEIESFTEFARIAEDALFDAVFLAEGLRIHESSGRIVEHNVSDRPDPVTRLSALAARTSRIGLIGTGNATHSEPFDIARRFATLDLLSGGRAGWNLVTASDPLISASFRRGQFLAHEDRYRRAGEVLDAVRSIWRNGDSGTRRLFKGDFLDLEGRYDLPSSPQTEPVIVQSGDSPEGRDLTARGADVIFTEGRDVEAGRAFYRDIGERLSKAGRERHELKIMANTRFVLGDTPAEAEERAESELRARITPNLVLSYFEDAWGQDLSDHDVDGPLPTFDPDPEHRPSVRITTRRAGAPRTAGPIAARWRKIAATTPGGTLREVVTALLRDRIVVTGTPRQVADELVRRVTVQACDGFVLAPSVLPGGLREFTERVVPLLQEQGRYRTRYEGTTLREHLAPAQEPASRRAPI